MFRAMPRYGLVFANGDLNDGPAIRAALKTAESPLVIAADGGLRHAQALGLHPDIIIGDMDSADPAMLDQAAQGGTALLSYPTHKDETDLELALITAVQRGCDLIRVIGAIGGRLDQTISNVYLLALPELVECDVRLVSGTQTMWLAYPGMTPLTAAPNDTLSLVPLAGEVTNIVTEGLAYPLRGETLKFGPARGVSNVFLSTEARVTFESGLLLIVHTIGRA